MRKLLIILTLLSSGQFLRAQDVDFGFCVGTHLLHRVQFDQAYYFPENSYQGYYSGDPNEQLINKYSFVNSLHLGSTATGTYKRWGFTLEPQFFFQRSTYKFNYPVVVERVVGRKAFRMPMFISYKLVKKKHGPFALFGLIFHKENNFDFQSPGQEVYLLGQPLSSVAVDFGDNHFYRVMYTEKAYFSYVFGLGYTNRKGMSVSLRGHKRLNTQTRGISANIFNFEMSINFPIVSISEITNKHFIYVD